jgi:molybdate transport system permease protein
VSAELAQIAVFTTVAALLATALMLVPGVGLAWLLARGRFPGRALLETLVSLPLVMPPVATGLLLLWAFSRRGPLGAALGAAGIEVVFTPLAVVIAMAVMGLPLLVRTARAGFEQVTRRYEQMAETLGAGPWRVFRTVTLPLASSNILAGALLGFSRALGEFGATIVVAGSIPGRTRTLAVGIYSFTEVGRDREAIVLLVVSLCLAFGAVLASNRLSRQRRRRPCSSCRCAWPSARCLPPTVSPARGDRPDGDLRAALRVAAGRVHRGAGRGAGGRYARAVRAVRVG